MGNLFCIRCQITLALVNCVRGDRASTVVGGNPRNQDRIGLSHELRHRSLRCRRDLSCQDSDSVGEDCAEAIRISAFDLELVCGTLRQSSRDVLCINQTCNKDRESSTVRRVVIPQTVVNDCATSIETGREPVKTDLRSESVCRHVNESRRLIWDLGR